MTLRCLSFHADYACRRSGACCTSGWPIPIERDRLDAVEHAHAAGRLGLASGTPLWLRPTDAPPDTPALLGTNEHGCVCFDAAGGRLCRIQRALGHAALPLACRQFPRVSVRDPRGASVTLSHFCPTAAELLDGDGPIAIVARDAAFGPDAELVGLDVRTALPPLLRPDMLMDWEAAWEWERRAVGAIADERTTPADALDQLDLVIETLRRWTPADGALADAAERAFAQGDIRSRQRRRDPDARRREIIDAIPSEFQAPDADGGARPAPDAMRRLLAAHAFGSWVLHLGGGLRSWLRSLDAVCALVDVGYSVRQTDLLLRHLADTNALTDAWNRAERE